MWCNSRQIYLSWACPGNKEQAAEQSQRCLRRTHGIDKLSIPLSVYISLETYPASIPTKIRISAQHPKSVKRSSDPGTARQDLMCHENEVVIYRGWSGNVVICHFGCFFCIGCLPNLFNETLEFALSSPVRAVHDMEITLQKCSRRRVALSRIG